jgi:TPP-dependent pyruvate/acetoin dehydrogenase alpha subunit
MSHHKEPILPPSGKLTSVKPKASNQELVALLTDMVRIREFEEKVQRLFMKGLIHGTTHLCQGQEAVSIGVARVMEPQDYVTMTYRSHGHAIARGMDLEAIFAELMGRVTGICRGKGGSMHLTDFTKNVIGSFGIIGAGMPVGLGAAMSAKLKGEDRVSVSFFGDGTTNIGAFHETMNMASVWKAPVVFVCENNIYGEFSRIDETTAVLKLSERAASYQMPSVTIDGNNVLEVMDTVRKAIKAARLGEGPSFIECVTYRHRGHSRTDPAKYRPEAEVQAWLAYDPIHLYADWLIEHHICGQTEVNQITETIRAEVDIAADRAEQAPWPEAKDAELDVYAEA